MTWRQLEIQLQDRLVHALIDDRFAQTVPIRELPCLNWFGVWFTKPAPQDAFVAPEEEQALLALERRLIEVAGKQAHGWAVYCLRLLSRGIAEYYLYSRDASTLAGVVAEMQQHCPEYRIEHETKDDPPWFEYSKYLRATA
jgi:hypothetical protein